MHHGQTAAHSNREVCIFLIEISPELGRQIQSFQAPPSLSIYHLQSWLKQLPMLWLWCPYPRQEAKVKNSKKVHANNMSSFEGVLLEV